MRKSSRRPRRPNIIMKTKIATSWTEQRRFKRFSMCSSPAESRRHLFKKKKQQRRLRQLVMKMEDQGRKRRSPRPYTSYRQISLNNVTSSRLQDTVRPPITQLPLLQTSMAFHIIFKIKYEIKKSLSKKTLPPIDQHLNAIHKLEPRLALGNQMQRRSRLRGTCSPFRKSSSSTGGIFSCLIG